MKIAVIPPVALLDTYGVLGDKYHLCLSHQVFKYPEYVAFYRERARLGDHVILDNSAHERLDGDGVEVLETAARMIRPTEIVLPDRLFFGDDTLERSTEAYHQLRATFPHVKLMGVPQGRTRQEWIDCLRGLAALGVDSIGISKDYEVWDASEGLRVLVGRARAYVGRSIHLLGWGRKLHHLAYLADDVRGVDSAKPLVYALSGVRLPDVLTEATIPKYPRRAGDYFATTQNGHDDFDAIARHNIGVFRHYARGGHLARGTGFAPVGT